MQNTVREIDEIKENTGMNFLDSLSALFVEHSDFEFARNIKENNNLGIRLDIYNKNLAMIISKFDISQFTFNTGNTDKILITFLRSGSGTPDGYTLISNIQLEEGTQATPYEPYYERTQTVYLTSPPHKGDEIVCKEDGLYHWHKRKQKVLNANEGWIKDNNELTNTVRFYIPSYVIDGIPTTRSKAIANYPTSTKSTYNVDEENLQIATDSALYIRINKSKATTLEEFKSLLQSNSIKFVYELAEPYFEKISDDKLLLEIPNNATLSVESVIPCTSISATYTGNVPSLYGMENSILEIEEHNVDMVATTFDMDYRLLEVEWALEDAGLTGISLASTFNLNRKGEKKLWLYQDMNKQK